MNERYHDLDALRAFAMVLGVAFHSALFVTPLRYFPWPVHVGVVQPAITGICLFIHIFRLPLFFFLAGCFAHVSYQRSGARGFIYHRLIRIGLPLFIYLLLASPIHGYELYLLMNNHIKITTPIVINTLGFIGPLWFLYYLLGYALLFATVLTFRQRIPFKLPYAYLKTFLSKPLTPLFLSLPAMILLWLNNSIDVIPFYTLELNPAIFCYYLLFFIFGWCYFDCRKQLGCLYQKSFHYLWAALLLSLLYVLLIPYEQDMPSLFKPLMLCHAVIAWLMLFGLLGVFHRYANAYNAVISYLASSSYWVYLIEVPVIILLQLFLMSATPYLWLNAVCIFLIGLVFTLITYRWVRHSFVRIVITNNPSFST